MSSTKKSGSNDTGAFNKSLGSKGEQAAMDYLQKHGFKILEQNYLCQSGEVDLIADKKGEIHFVEVKTRSSRRFGSPLESVHHHKKSRMSRAAQFYLLRNPQYDSKPKFFSVVSIDYTTDQTLIEFIPNAFEIVGRHYY